MCDDEILVFSILTRSPELYSLEIEDGIELFIDKATLLISASFNLISNSSAVLTVIASQQTMHFQEHLDSDIIDLH